MVSIERLHELIDDLPEAERDEAARVLEALTQVAAVPGTAFFDAPAEEAVLRPDVAPIHDIDELRGDFWPEDEGPDDFVNAVRAWRRDGSSGNRA